MKAAIYNPYLDTLGGGERYTLAFAKALLEKGYSVDIEWSDNAIKRKIESRFGIDLKNINIVQDVKRGDTYDVCFWVSDGSIPALKARRNILHFQVPFTDVNGGSLLNKMKLFRIKHIVVNSQFTKSYIDKEFGVESKVLYPPVDTKSIKPKRKGNIILSVARFSELMQAKRQDVLINVFKKLYDSGIMDWKLVLIGASDVGSSSIVTKLKQLKEGYPISLFENLSFDKVKKYYGQAKIFWSASGFEVSEFESPEKVEHFGIAVAEAMAASCVTVIYKAGGHKEIVNDSDNGFLWSSQEELFVKTLKLTNDKKLLKQMSANSQKSSERFSYERFFGEVIKMIE